MKCLIRFSFVVLLPVVAPRAVEGQPASATDAVILEQLEEVEAALRIQDATRAREIVESLVERYPHDPRPYLSASYLELEEGNLDHALRLASHSLHIRPSTPALVNLAQLYLRGRRTVEAVNAARRATAMDPHFPLAWVRLAEGYKQDNVPIPADQALERALEIDPGFVPALLSRAENYLIQGQIENARKTTRLVLKEDANHPTALIMMARIAAADEQHGSALEYLYRVLENPTSDLPVHRQIAESLVRCGSLEAAEPHFRAAIRQSPKDERPYFGLGMVLLRQGKTQESKEVMSQYLEVRRQSQAEQKYSDGTSPDSPLSIWKQALEQDPQAALPRARACVERDPEDPVARLALASALILLGSQEEAIPHAEIGSSLAPCHPLRHLNLGGAFYQAGNWNLARRCWLKALYADPAFAPAIDLLVRTEFQLSVAGITRIPTAERSAAQDGCRSAAVDWLQDRKTEAIQRFAELTERYPAEAPLRTHLALAYLGNHDWPEALRYFRGPSGEDPADWGLTFYSAVALANTGKESEALQIWDRIGMSYSFPIITMVPPHRLN